TAAGGGGGGAAALRHAIAPSRASAAPTTRFFSEFRRIERKRIKPSGPARTRASCGSLADPVDENFQDAGGQNLRAVSRAARLEGGADHPPEESRGRRNVGDAEHSGSGAVGEALLDEALENLLAFG